MAVIRSEAEDAVTLERCSFRTTYPTPGRSIRVLGSTPKRNGRPKPLRLAKLVPAALVP